MFRKRREESIYYTDVEFEASIRGGECLILDKFANRGFIWRYGEARE